VIELYREHEEAARSALVRAAVLEAQRGRAAADKAAVAPPLWAQPVAIDPRKVEQLAESAVAPAVDAAWRTRPAAERKLDNLALSFDNAKVQPLVVQQNLVVANITLGNINNIQNTNNNTNTFAPVFQPSIALPGAGRDDGNLCTTPGLAGVACWGAGNRYVLRPQGTFAIADWQRSAGSDADAVQRGVKAIGEAAAAFGRQRGIVFRANVTGYASHENAARLCAPAGWTTPQVAPFVVNRTANGRMELAFRSRLNGRASVAVACGAKGRGDDGNVLLGAARAAWAAGIVEEAAAGAVAVERIASSGAKDAFRGSAAGTGDGDRTVVVELETVGLR